MNDPRLDRKIQFDDKSRQFPIRQLVITKKDRSYTWRCDRWLDQGTEGACVGFSMAHEIIARPKVVMVNAAFAREKIYYEARKIDPWEGEDYEGTSVLAGVKVLQKLGFIKEYRWAFGLDDLILAVGYAGPAVIGVNWYTGMMKPDDNGIIRVSGELAGGHAILCNGVSIKGKYFRLHNSWGEDWGKGGDCFISFDDMRRLLSEDGEACIPVVRSISDIMQS